MPWARKLQGTTKEVEKKRACNRFAIKRMRLRIKEKVDVAKKDGYLRRLFFDELRLTQEQVEELAFFLCVSGVPPRRVECYFDMAFLLGYWERKSLLYLTRNFYKLK